jgi:tellurite resistance protein TehA-like permease
MIQPDYDPQLAAENIQRLSENGLSFMGVDVFDSTMLLSLIIRFTVNFLICWLLTRFFYYPKSKRKDYYFTFILFSVTVFLLLFILQKLSISVGFALGLFCIFGMIKYRTESIQIREMTYLFVIIGISAINGLSVDVDYITVLIANMLVLFITWILERNVRQAATKIVLYERIALIVPEKYDELLADLKQRTGLNIDKIEIGHIDFLRDVAYLKIYYQSNSDEINTIDHIIKFS